VDWLGCNCHDGLTGGALLGGGSTAVWEALKTIMPRETHLIAPGIARASSASKPFSSAEQRAQADEGLPSFA